MISPEKIMEMYEYITSKVNTLNDEATIESINKLFDDFSDRMIETPGSTNIDSKYCYPGGYIHEIYDTLTISEQLCKVWGVDSDSYSLIKSILLHNISKLGDENGPYLTQVKDKWKLDRGERYEYNNNIMFMLPIDRTFYIIQKYNITLTQHEYLNIRLINGLLDESNDKYLRTTKNSAGIEHIILRQAKEIAFNMNKPTPTVQQPQQKKKVTTPPVSAKLNTTVLNLLDKI
jgi:hypothetical protein